MPSPQLFILILKRFIRNSGGSEDDVNEIEQKCIVILYEKIVEGSFELYNNTKLSTYLFSIAKNLWRKKTQNNFKFLEVNDDILSPLEDIDQYRFDEIDKEERQLVESLNNLGEKCQKILRAKYFEKKSDRDLADELGDMEEKNIRKKRYKCLQQLKSHFLKKISRNE